MDNIDHQQFTQEWAEPSHLNNRHEALIGFAVLGYPTALIAEKLDYSVENVRKLLRAPNVQEKINLERNTKFNQAVKDRMDNLCGLATETLERILLSPDANSSSKIQAATYLLDHLVGKPKATLEVQNTTLRDIMEQLQNHNTIITEKPKDAFDLIIEQVIPTNMIVGQRKTD